MQGGHLYALSVALDHPDQETMVVLLTDGQPQFWNSITQQYEPGCQDNGFSRVATVAYSAFLGTPSVKTYVIGITNDADSATLREGLDLVADGGATTSAQMVRDADPNNSPLVSQAAVATSLRRVLEQLRDSLITCDVPLPDPPSGQALVPDQLNLSYITANDFQQTIAYSADCASGVGWRYDNLGAPTKIELCSESCDTVRTTAASQLQATFGCVTEGLGGEGGATGQAGQGGQPSGVGGGGGSAPVGGATALGGASPGGATSTGGSAGSPAGGSAGSATGGSAGNPSTAGSAGASNPSLGGTTGSAGVSGSTGTPNAGAGG
jgi:hypothetical protein